MSVCQLLIYRNLYLSPDSQLPHALPFLAEALSSDPYLLENSFALYLFI